MVKSEALLLLISVCFHSYLFSSVDRKYAQRFAESEAVLDPSGELLLRWKVDYYLKKIQFRIVITHKNVSQFNWIAFGFSDRGELSNADVCLLWTDYKGEEHFEDMHSDSDGRLIRDERQDYHGFYLNAKERSIVFERFFDSCDDNDYIIEDGTVHIIWARGSDKLYSSKGLGLSCTSPQNHGFIRVRLLTPPTTAVTKGLELRFTNKHLKVPSTATTYWCKVIKLQSLLTEKVHYIVQTEPTISKGNEGLVHHMELFYCDAAPNEQIPLYEGNCFAQDRPEITKRCSKVKAAWAMGAKAFIYPKEAGLPLGGGKANKYVMLEVHYNNPEMRNDWVDSSGIVIKVTGEKRKFDAGIIELGLEYSDKMAIPAGQEAFPLTGHCIPECTGVGLPPQGIVVFGSQLHTHLTGIAVWTRHIRKGIELPMLNQDLHYSTHFQEIRILHRPVRVLPGDHLETTCIYNTLDRDNATIGGHAITDEMCVNYMYYYPVTELEVCKSAVSNKALENYFKFEKRWDDQLISFDNPPRANYLAIKPWTVLRANALSTLYVESPISMQCNKSDGNRFQGEWEGIAVSKVKIPLQKPKRFCT